MSLIFDRFPSVEKATDFAVAVERQFKLKAQVFMDLGAANQHDPFPFPLDVPIVHVDRPTTGHDIDWEQEPIIQQFVEMFGGHFAGT